jgi:hypothetical protein
VPQMCRARCTNWGVSGGETRGLRLARRLPVELVLAQE